MPRQAPDQEQRDRAIAERKRNVLVDAGAGTGKTTLLVDRLVEMVAPCNGGRAFPISRIAAITFTRKAAGELRLRIRERLLRELAGVQPSSERDRRLRDAIAELDTAHVGTIHSFADRLLRLRPVEAELSPSYEIVEDDASLVRETFDVLMQSMESGTLAAELEGTGAAARAEEAAATILDALAAGLKTESRETEWKPLHGLDALVVGFIRARDVPPPDDPPAAFDAGAFAKSADEMVRLCKSVPDLDAPGTRWLRRVESTLERLREERDPARILREFARLSDAEPADTTKGRGFANHDGAYDVWKAWEGDDRKRRLRDGSLRDELRAPLDRWLATRLARLFPVVVALYEKVKARRQQLDQLDLLVKLRDLLARDKTARGEYQRMFDHVFVDEFQDTDPLQAEIVLYLCEREPRADRWEDVALSDGKLTLVGDPKQSIYRFRRADIAMYDRVRRVVARGDHLEVTLSANFRSVPPLIGWFNDRFARVLGASADGGSFDPVSGKVFHQALDAGREGSPSPGVWILPFDFGDGKKHKVDQYRQLEGRVLARFLGWLVEASDVKIVDPLDGRPRRVRYGDVAVLAVSTWRLGMLFPHLDAEDIPYASRGGTLFLNDPLHRQFLLGLRALADRDDGIAEAALLRPPFFSIDPIDLLRERHAGEKPSDEGAARAREARELVGELRRQRLDRPPGVTARDLLERTALARGVALGPNGAQRLARLRELCLLLDQTAASGGLDYDSVTARVREWVESPPQIDPPHPVGTEAVQVMTVHQAKGLEFPVIILWDGKGQWGTRSGGEPWRMERDGRGWLLDIEGLAWGEPAGTGIHQTEQAYLDAERRRVVYVAATRARNMLVIPKAGEVAPGQFVCGDLLSDAPAQFVQAVEPYVEGAEPAWARQTKRRARLVAGDAADLERRAGEQWATGSREAARPRFRPASVSGDALATPAVESEEFLKEVAEKPHEGRFGGVFGSVVHHAIGLALRDGALAAQEAVRRAAERYGLKEHFDEAVADLKRAMDALRAEGLGRAPSANLQLEYPIAGAWEEGQLMSGYIDLVAVTDGHADVIDFKTDAPPERSVERTYPKYAAQVRAYRRLLEAAGIGEGRHLRCGLLFTADGGIRWVEGCVPRQS